MGAPVIEMSPGGAQTVRKATWTLTQADATGIAVGPDWADYADMTIQFIGTPGAATLVFQGSNDGTNWQPLTAPSGSAISGTSVSIRQVVENPLYKRAVVTGADGSTAITAILAAKRPTLGRG